MIILLFVWCIFPELANAATKKKVYTSEQVRCLADNIYAEAGNQSYSAKVFHAEFTISEAKRIGRSICKETFSKIKNGKKYGAYKYSWVYEKNKFYKRKTKNILEIRSYADSYDIADNLLYQENLHHNIKNPYSNYITVTLAKSNKVPRWFKHHIISYRINGDHVYVKLSNKKSLVMYNKFLNES